MNEPCKHTVTQGRQGARGDWCVACGVKVYEVHDKPCRQCRHSKELFDGWICSRHLMAITADMFVTYKIGEDSAHGGLCFESAQTDAALEPADE